MSENSGMTDALSNHIRAVDGSHSLGAGALAEKIMEFFQPIIAERDALRQSVKARKDLVYAGQPQCQSPQPATLPATPATDNDSAGFAKVFGNGRDQILIKLDSGDKGPEVQVFFRPTNLGVCCLSIKFTDDDSGWRKAESAFAEFDEPMARGYIAPAIASLTFTDDEDEA